MYLFIQIFLSRLYFIKQNYSNAVHKFPVYWIIKCYCIVLYWAKWHKTRPSCMEATSQELRPHIKVRKSAEEEDETFNKEEETLFNNNNNNNIHLFQTHNTCMYNMSI